MNNDYAQLAALGESFPAPTATTQEAPIQNLEALGRSYHGGAPSPAPTTDIIALEKEAIGIPVFVKRSEAVTCSD